MTKLEKNYLLSLLIVFIVIFVAGIGSMVYAFIVIFQQNSILNNILELIYMAVHLIAAFLGIYFSRAALRSGQGSNIMKTLMIDPRFNGPSKMARIVAIVLSSVGLLAGTYFTLVLCGVPLPSFNFPIALVLDLINSPFTVFIIGLYFVFYPTIYIHQEKEK